MTRAVNVQNSDLIKGNANVPFPYNTEFTLDNNDALLIIEQNDYTVAGETYQIQGIQIMQGANGFDGYAINLNGATGANGGSSATSNLTAWDPTDNDVLKIVDIGFVQQTSGTIDASLDFAFNIQDGDGDTTGIQHIPVIVGGSALTAASSATGWGRRPLPSRGCSGSWRRRRSTGRPPALLLSSSVLWTSDVPPHGPPGRPTGMGFGPRDLDRRGRRRLGLVLRRRAGTDGPGACRRARAGARARLRSYDERRDGRVPVARRAALHVVTGGRVRVRVRPSSVSTATSGSDTAQAGGPTTRSASVTATRPSAAVSQIVVRAGGSPDFLVAPS